MLEFCCKIIIKQNELAKYQINEELKHIMNSKYIEKPFLTNNYKEAILTTTQFMAALIDQIHLQFKDLKQMYDKEPKHTLDQPPKDMVKFSQSIQEQKLFRQQTFNFLVKLVESSKYIAMYC